MGKHSEGRGDAPGESSAAGGKPPVVGGLELDVLRYISDRAPVTLREVVDGYGVEKGLARTTILTVMDRLRRKGLLVRRKEMDTAGIRRKGGVFVYEPAMAKSRLLSDLVRGFVDKSLDGSLSPFVAYLVDAKGLTDDEAEQLRRLIDG